jgi:two-component system, sporulation sensor kinase B
MILEKLLLNVLISLSAIFVHGFIEDRKNVGRNPYIIGGLHSIAAFLCITFSYVQHGIFWDLRYVPLVVSCIYGGPIAGIMVLVSMLLARNIFGIDSWILGNICIILAALTPLLLSPKFKRIPSNRRIKTILLSGILPAITTLMALLGYVYLGMGNVSIRMVMMNTGLFFIIYSVAFAAAIMLNEAMIERSRMKEDIARAEKLNALGEIAASIAHEIRNPLTVVKGFLQLMRQREPEKAVHYLPLILTEVGRAETILNEYLSFSRPHLKKTELFPLVPLLSNVLILLEPLALIEGVQLESRFTGNPSVNGDRNQLQQALLNLTKNAIEATPNGGHVSMRLSVEQHMVYIRVSDTGKGMSQEQLQRLGNLFYSTKDKGTGLGTAVSWQMIRNMNGTIQVDSKPGMGTQVTIALPVAQ